MTNRIAGPLAAAAVVLAAGAIAGTARAARAAGPDFTRDVRPILAKHCFRCHGPDDKTREGGLRLDDRDAAIRKKALVPGKPDDSELVKRIVSTDENEVMPPPAAKIPLSAKDKQVLREWVAAGAEYRAHWSFVPPAQAPLPAVKRAEWVRNPVDRFVLARLEAEGLSPSAEADRLTLARRLSLDLTGLPPTPEEADAFAADQAPDAYEKFVDRLLASPRYGERWARRWLDLARYADTNGYEKDRGRSIWPYRDWVVAALNADMPFDRFTIEQLAGDMLPNATPEQRVATGFHRNTMLNEEGGIDPLEFRFHAMADRVAVTGTVWMGLTVGCAQCHTHKYDPLPHRDYYRLFALLNNADEPEMAVPRPDINARRAEIAGQVAAAEAALAGRFPPDLLWPAKAVPEAARRRLHLQRRFAEWLARETARATAWTPLRPVSAASKVPTLTVLDDDSVFVSGDQSKSDTYELAFRTALRGITAVRLEAIPDERLPRGGPGRVSYEGPFGDFFLSEITLDAAGKPRKFARAAQSHAKDKKNAAAAIDGDPQTGWSIDGGQGKPQTAVFTLAEPVSDTGDLTVRMLFERYYASGLGRFRISVTTAPQPTDARDLPAEVEDALAVPADRRTPEQSRRLMAHFLSTCPELAKERAEIDRLRKSMPALPTTLVMQERPAGHARATFLHNRGEFLQPTVRVEPGIPEFLPPLPKDAPADRLALARWLVSDRNPLVARVTVNREWSAFFGRGLVRTLGDFGLTGEAPSHPDLLDWLAVEFVKQGWSLKKLHRLIVTSATYRQSVKIADCGLRIADSQKGSPNPQSEIRNPQSTDPENRLLSRGPRHRLEAEIIRDAALRSAGLLSEKMGGPGVFPPQPPGVTTEGAYGKLDWRVSGGEDRHRRSLYTFHKRTAPFALYATFDAPSGETCVARRDVTDTPLQGLALLNDPVFMDAAQALGRLGAADKGTDAERAARLFRRVLTRPPTAEETAALARFVAAQRKRFAAKELDPSALAGPAEKGSDPVERAAWTALGRALLNVDEFVTKE
jgi:hypothetical protein